MSASIEFPPALVDAAVEAIDAVYANGDGSGDLDEIAVAVLAIAHGPWTFDLLLAIGQHLLDAWYPADVFTGVSGDPGARLVAAVRDCLEVVRNRTGAESETRT